MPDETNLLAIRSWGLQPHSKVCRRRALRFWLGRTTLYSICLCGLMGFFLHDYVAYYQFHKYIGQQFVPYYLTSWAMGLIFCAAAPFLLESRFSNPRLLRVNIHDFYLAGIDGRSILTGIAAPQLAGVKLFAWIYALVLLSLSLLLNSLIGLGIFAREWLLIGTSVVSAIFFMVAGLHYEISMWFTEPGKAIRAIKLTLFAFTSPGILFCVIEPFARIDVSFEVLSLVCAMEFVAMFFRGRYVHSAWKKATLRLQDFPEDGLQK